MKSLVLGIAASLTLIASSPAESPYEQLVVVRPAPPVVRATEARELVNDVNRMRSTYGLPSVTVDDLLSRAALLYAQDMARRKFFGHFTPDGASLPDRLQAVGFHWSVAAENIALDEDARHANAALLQSPSHRANILDPRVRKIGVAALGVGAGAALYVEDFAL
jgi:uncharacterized protein YkwD